MKIEDPTIKVQRKNVDLVF